MKPFFRGDSSCHFPQWLLCPYNQCVPDQGPLENKRKSYKQDGEVLGGPGIEYRPGFYWSETMVEFHRYAYQGLNGALIVVTGIAPIASPPLSDLGPYQISR